MANPRPGVAFGYLSKFNLTEKLLTSETDLVKDLVLYDNPNNGNFKLSGSIPAKEKCSVYLYDLSGKLLYRSQLEKTAEQSINLK